MSAVPQMSHAERRARHSKIAQALRDGDKPQDVADRFGVSFSLVCRIGNANGIDVRGRRKRPNSINHAELLQLYAGPESIPALAKRYGVTVHGIRYVLAKHGIKFQQRYREPKPLPALSAPIAIRPEPEYTDRDPCPFCGVRGDLGCRHKGRAVAVFVPREVAA